MGLPQIFRTARLLGDKSSLQKGFADVPRRGGVRVLGRAAGKFQAGLSVHNLIIYASFLRWMRTSIENKNARPVYIVNAMQYAHGYNTGFQSPDQVKGRRTSEGYGFWQRGIEEAFNPPDSSSGGMRVPKLKFNRSGLYIAGRFTADIKAIYRGSIVSRLARRASGREMTRFWWGTMRNPNMNINEVIARRAVANIRRNIRGAGLVDTQALVMATQMGDTFEEALSKSRNAAMKKLAKKHGANAGNAINRKVH